MKVSAITRPVLARLQGEIEQSDYSTAVKNECVQMVRPVFAYRARIYGGDDPAVVMHSLRKTSAEVTRGMEHPVWTPQQFQSFMDAMPDDRRVYKILFEVLFWSGLRRGEAIALQKADLDLKAHALIVRHSKRNRTQELSPTKTSQQRTVPLDEITWADVTDVYDHSDGPYLFGGAESLPPTDIDRLFHKVTDVAGLPRIRIHDLRHSHATWLILHGVSIVAVSRRLGHASVEQTLTTYTHLLPDVSATLMDALDTEHASVSEAGRGRSVGAGYLKAEKTGEGEDEKTASECDSITQKKTGDDS